MQSELLTDEDEDLDCCLDSANDENDNKQTLDNNGRPLDNPHKRVQIQQLNSKHIKNTESIFSMSQTDEITQLRNEVYQLEQQNIELTNVVAYLQT